MNTLTPSIPHRFDFVEVATSDLASTQSLFERLGFSATQEFNDDTLSQRLMIQGRIRVLLSRGKAGTYQNDYVLKNGEGVCAIGYHVDSAKKALHHMRQAKSQVVQEFVNLENDEMFLQSSAVLGPADIRIVFVTRSGAPHDVLAPFAPGFQKITNSNAAHEGIGMLTFSSILGPDELGRVHLTFVCADCGKGAGIINQSGFSMVDKGAFLLPLFGTNKAAQLFLHLRNN